MGTALYARPSINAAVQTGPHLCRQHELVHGAPPPSRALGRADAPASAPVAIASTDAANTVATPPLFPGLTAPPPGSPVAPLPPGSHLLQGAAQPPGAGTPFGAQQPAGQPPLGGGEQQPPGLLAQQPPPAAAGPPGAVAAPRASTPTGTPAPSPAAAGTPPGAAASFSTSQPPSADSPSGTCSNIHIHFQI